MTEYNLQDYQDPSDPELKKYLEFLKEQQKNAVGAPGQPIGDTEQDVVDKFDPIGKIINPKPNGSFIQSLIPQTSSTPNPEVGQGAVIGDTEGQVAGTSIPDESVATAPKKSIPTAESKAANPTSIADFLNFGQNDVASKEGLQAAIDERNKRQMIANIAAGANTFSGGLARTGPVDNSFYNNLSKQAEQSVTDYEKKVEFQKQDPNSSYSQGLRDYFKSKLGIQVRGDASAVDLEKIMPFAVREFEAKEARSARKQETSENRIQRAEDRAADRELKATLYGAKSEKDSGKADIKAEDKANDGFTKMALQLNGAKSSSRNAMGKAALNKAAAERLEALVAGRDLNKLNTREVQEVAKGMDSLLSQGAATITGTEKLAPHTLQMKFANWKEYLTNDNAAAEAKSFLIPMMKTVAREKELAQNQLNKYKQELIPGYEHLEKKDPDRFNRVLYGGVSSEPTSQSVLPAQDTTKDAEAIAWANANPNDPRAKKILQLHGK